MTQPSMLALRQQPQEAINITNQDKEGDELFQVPAKKKENDLKDQPAN